MVEVLPPTLISDFLAYKYRCDNGLFLVLPWGPAGICSAPCLARGQACCRGFDRIITSTCKSMCSFLGAFANVWLSSSYVTCDYALQTSTPVLSKCRPRAPSPRGSRVWSYGGGGRREVDGVETQAWVPSPSDLRGEESLTLPLTGLDPRAAPWT